MRLMSLLVVGLLLIAWLAAFAGSVAWVWRDAERRGQPGFIVAVLVAFLFWPLSLVAWLAARPAQSGPGGTATPGRGARGCLWGALILVLIMVFFIALGILLPVFFLTNVRAVRPVARQQAVSQAKRAESSAVVKGVAAAYLAYRDTHGQPPATLADLALDPNQFPAHARCELLPGTNATDIIVREDWANHGGQGGAIAFGDGSVAWVDSPYKPLRMDVVKAAVEQQLRQQLGEEFVKVGSMTFNAQENRYDIGIFLNINGEFRRILDLSQIGAREQERRGRDQKRLQDFLTRSARHAVRWDEAQDLSVYAGSLEIRRQRGDYLYEVKVDEMLEREPQVEEVQP